MVVQVPTFPMRLQDSQVVPHAALQQTPSTQKLLVQSAATLQVCPFTFLQPPLPSQELVSPHTGAVSVPLTTILPQVPFRPCPFAAAEHAWHVPAHAALQQLPSTQKPLVHSLAAAQACPLIFLQIPLPSHVLVPLHTGLVSVPPAATLVQVPTLPTALHTLQSVLQAALQHTPSAQKPLRHSVPALHAAAFSFLQLPAPSQVFVPVQMFNGKLSSTFAATFEHVPTLPASAHVLHAVLQAELQQTLSTQLPLRHSVPTPQAAAFSFLQLPAPSHVFVPVQMFAGKLSS
jgi:hypothetical protein